MDPITWGLVGLIAGGALTAGGILVFDKDDEPAPIVDNSVAAVQQEVILQLTDLHIASVPCSSDFIETYTDGLCREMFCRMQSRGIDSQTSGAECEEIANINNTVAILATCSDIEAPEAAEACYTLFRERK